MNVNAKKIIQIVISVTLLCVGIFVLKNIFNVQPASAAWYATGGTWSYRKPIIINNTQVSQTNGNQLSNFPVLISVTDADLKSKALASGNDIIFTGADGSTLLNYQIEKYDSTKGQLIAWVKVPTLYSATSSNQSIIYEYYGNAAAGAEASSNIQNVWSNYAAVYHLPNGTILNYNDSSSNINNLTASGTPTAINGQVDGAATFSAAQSASTTESSSLQFGSNSFSISIWFNTATNMTIGLVRNNAGAGIKLQGFGGGGQARISDGTNAVFGTSVTGKGDSLWHYAVVTIDRSANLMHEYVDSKEITPAVSISTVGSITDSTATLCLNGFATNGVCSGGGAVSLDEARLSSSGVILSPDWIGTEYNNQKNPSSFYSYGSIGIQNRTATTAAEGIRGTTKIRGGVKFR